jgi:hypothetical protein
MINKKNENKPCRRYSLIIVQKYLEKPFKAFAKAHEKNR